MKKAIPVISYLAYLALGAYLAISSKIELEELSDKTADSFGQGLANGIGGIGLAIVMVLGLIYSAAALLGLIMKLLHNASGWGFFGLLSIIFDLAFTVVHGYIMLYALNGGTEMQTVAIFGGLLVLSAASLVANCSALTNR